MLKEEIGSKLRVFLNNSRSSAEKIAETIDLSGRYFQDLCSGKKEPSATTIVKICSGLRVSADWLLGLDIKQPVMIPASVEQRLKLLQGQNEKLEKEVIEKDIENDSLTRRLNMEINRSAKLTLKGQAAIAKHIPVDFLEYVPHISSEEWEMIKDMTVRAKEKLEKTKQMTAKLKKRLRGRKT